MRRPHLNRLAVGRPAPPSRLPLEKHSDGLRAGARERGAEHRWCGRGPLVSGEPLSSFSATALPPTVIHSLPMMDRAPSWPQRWHCARKQCRRVSRGCAARVDDPLACADSETPSQRGCRVTGGTITCTTTTQRAVLPMVRPRSGDEAHPSVKGAAVCACAAAGASLKEYPRVEWSIEPTEHDHRCCARRSSITHAHGGNRRSPYMISRSHGQRRV